MMRKNPNGNPAATYCYLVPMLQTAAKSCGYALALHGSMQYDLDLVAVPWIRGATDASTLIDELCKAIGTDRKEVSGPILKPHDREAWLINLHAGFYIDLSIMPLDDLDEEA